MPLLGEFSAYENEQIIPVDTKDPKDAKFDILPEFTSFYLFIFAVAIDRLWIHMIYGPNFLSSFFFYSQWLTETMLKVEFISLGSFGAFIFGC